MASSAQTSRKIVTPDFGSRIRDTSFERTTTMATKAGFLRGAGSAAITGFHSHAPETRFDVETLKTTAVFFGIGLIASLLWATNGMDISAGFF